MPEAAAAWGVRKRAPSHPDGHARSSAASAASLTRQAQERLQVASEHQRARVEWLGTPCGHHAPRTRSPETTCPPPAPRTLPRGKHGGRRPRHLVASTPPTPRPRHPPLSRGRRRTEPIVTSRPRAQEVRRGGAGWLRGRNRFPEEGTDRKGEGVGVGKRGGTFFTVFLLLGGGCECAWRGGSQAESCSPRHDAPGRTWSPASAAFLVM